jgi:hypothetical protein
MLVILPHFGQYSRYPPSIAGFRPRPRPRPRPPQFPVSQSLPRHPSNCLSTYMPSIEIPVTIMTRSKSKKEKAATNPRLSVGGNEAVSATATAAASSSNLSNTASTATKSNPSTLSASLTQPSSSSLIICRNK